MDSDAYHCRTCKHGIVGDCAKCESSNESKRMTQYDNTNRGVLFTNDRKESDKHPDWKGRLNINGVDHWVDGWITQGARGEFISLSLGKPCDKQGAAPAKPPQAKPAAHAQSRGYVDGPDMGDVPW